MRSSWVVRGVVLLLLGLILVYLGLGLAFHIGWKRAQRVCATDRATQGLIVEPEVFGGAAALVFDVVYWPGYARANLRSLGSLFATPCTR